MTGIRWNFKPGKNRNDKKAGRKISESLRKKPPITLADIAMKKEFDDENERKRRERSKLNVNY